MNKFALLLLTPLLVLICVASVEAQDSSAPLPITATNNIVVSASNREQDGLSGPVRRVRTEISQVSLKDGKVVASPRVLLEITTYDRLGNRVDNDLFAMSSMTLVGKEVYKYDDKGNIVEMTVRAEDGSILNQEIYTYEFDALGNWTKMMSSVAVVENGAVTHEPTEITYRTITYYLTANVAKVVKPQASPNNTSEPISASLPKNEATSERGLSEQKLERAVGDVTRNAVVPAPAVSPVGAAQLPTATTSASSLGETPSEVETDKAKESGNVTTGAQAVDQPPAPKPPAKPVSGGVLNAKATYLPLPVYPDIAKLGGTQGNVAVEILIDVTGKVISAKAVSGPSLLRRAAEYAARNAQFSPTLLSGQPLRVTGVINYNFSLK